MKTHTLHTLFATLVVMLCALFVPPQQAQAQEAYVNMSPDKTTLTFYYDKQRTSRQGQTWGIDEKNAENSPAWAGTLSKVNTTTTTAVFDESFKDFRPTSTKQWFQLFQQLTKIVGIQHLNTSEVTNMESMFFSCSSLTELNLSYFNTAKVTDISWMFYQCSALTSLNLSRFSTANVTKMNGMFWGCLSLESIALSNFNTAKVTEMSWMFYQCSALTKIFSSKTWQCKESDDMFKGCTKLEGAVKYDASKTDAKMANPHTGYFTFSREAYVQMSPDKKTLTFYYDKERHTRPGTTWDIDEKGADKSPAWAGTYTKPNTTTKAVFDKSFDDFYPTSTAYWFSYFKQLTTIEGVENLNTYLVTDMGGMFFSCSSLTALDLSTFNTEQVTNMESMFYGCSALEKLDLSTFNTAKVTNMLGMFANSSALQTINLSTFNTAKVTDMSWMFYKCSALKELDLKNFNTSKVETVSYMFQGGSALTTIYSNNTWQCEYSGDMFKDCKQLQGAVKYDASKVDVTMANPNNGYFTFKKEAYVQMSADKKTLTFFYDTKRHTRSGTTWGINEKLPNRIFPQWTSVWHTPNLTTTKGVIDESFKDFRPTSTTYWFVYYQKLNTIEGLQHLNTSEVTDMEGMFGGCKSLTALDLSRFNTDKVTKMLYLFAGCSSLTALDLSRFNTDKVTDMRNMFAVCSSLTALDLSSFNTHNVRDMNHMFADCEALKEINLKNFNTAQVIDMSRMFNGCKALTALDLSSFNTEKVGNMNWMFSGCSALEKLDLSSFNTEEVRETNWMFSDCSALKELDLSNFNTAKVWNMMDMFVGCSALKKLDLSSFNTSEVISMSDMFYGCSALKELDLKNFKTENVTDMKDMFFGCSALTALDLSKFNTEKVKDMSYMFYNCSALKELDLSNFKTEKVTDMGYMFYECSALTAIYCANTWQCKESEDMFKDCTQLKGAVKYDASKVDVTMANPNNGYFTKEKKPEAYVQLSSDQKTLTFFYDTKRTSREGTTWGIEEKRPDVTAVPAWASTSTSPNTTTTKVVIDKSFDGFYPTSTAYWFLYYQKLNTIEGLQHLNTSEVTNMEGMFAHCSSLTALDLSNFRTEKVTNMLYMFAHCSSLTALDLSSFNTEKVTDMSSMFSGCSSLTALDLSSFNTAKVTDMSWMFSSCSALKELDLSNFNTEKVEDMSAMFSDCSALKGLDLSNFKTEKVTDMKNMFVGCSALKELDLSNFKTEKVTDMSYMFYQCSALKELNLSNFKTEKVTDMSAMFSGCSALTAIYCANTWQCEKSKDMFKDCTQLKGAVKYDASKVDVTMANPTTGYFTKEKPTAIEQMFLNAHKSKGIYTLQGKRVNGSLEHLPAGVYIVNGKKVVVK